MIKQHTLKSEIRTQGIGLHTGRTVRLVLRPAPANHGIVFRRIDLTPAVSIPAKANAVGDTRLSTSLIKDGVRISTIEHLMAALAGLGVDNCMVEVNADEIPIMDGSAQPFVELIEAVGLQEQKAPKVFVRILKEISVQQGDKTAKLLPYAGFKMQFGIEFNHPVFENNPLTTSLEVNQHSFRQQVAAARTFGFTHEIDQLRAQGLIKGGSTANAIVIGEQGVLNEEGLRSQDEFVKHKVLDALGDLYVLGHSLLGEFQAFKSGHHLNNLLLRELLRQPDAWEFVTSSADHRYTQPALKSLIAA